MNAQVHRMGDRVAVSLPGKGQTVYLTRKDARTLARAINGCARNIASQPSFTLSTFETVEIALDNRSLRT